LHSGASRGNICAKCGVWWGSLQGKATPLSTRKNESKPSIIITPFALLSTYQIIYSVPIILVIKPKTPSHLSHLCHPHLFYCSSIPPLLSPKTITASGPFSSPYSPQPSQTPSSPPHSPHSQYSSSAAEQRNPHTPPPSGSSARCSSSCTGSAPRNSGCSICPGRRWCVCRCIRGRSNGTSWAEDGGGCWRGNFEGVVGWRKVRVQMDYSTSDVCGEGNDRER
jgi:hypothetical protein